MALADVLHPGDQRIRSTPVQRTPALTRAGENCTSLSLRFIEIFDSAHRKLPFVRRRDLQDNRRNLGDAYASKRCKSTFKLTSFVSAPSPRLTTDRDARTGCPRIGL